MSMNRVIHCAVRRDLTRFRAALSAFDDGDRTRATALHRAWANFDDQLTEHHEGEHEIGFPAMRGLGIADELIDTFDAEHEAMATDLASARAAMGQLRSTASRADADAAAAAMERLEETTVTHLRHEEQETEAVLTQHDHPVVKEMSKQFSRRAGVAKAGVFMVWLQDGATPEARAGLRANVPGPVVAVIGGLFGRRYRKDIAPVWAGA